MSESDFFEHGGNLYATIRQKGGSIENLQDYSANINPLGLPDSVRQAVKENIDQVINYPDSEAAALKDAISRRYGIETELITVGNGAAELVYVLCHMLRPRRVLIPAPTFSEYERAARASGAAIEYLYLSPHDSFALSAEKLCRLLPQVQIVFLCNPNNPTGQVLPQEEAETIIAAANRHNVLVVVDESFLDFLPDQAGYSCRPLLKRYANLVILQSLTKFYAIPGLRLGFVLADRAIGSVLAKGKDPWNVNSLAQAAGCAALADDAYRTASMATVAAARETFITGLQSVPGFSPIPASANFILVDVTGTGYTSAWLRQAMLERNVLIRDCSNYPGLSSGYIRLAVKLEHQNKGILDAFQKILAKGQ